MRAQGTSSKRTPSMIGRRWHGRVSAAKAEEYLKLMKDVGLADYRSTAGQSWRVVPPPPRRRYCPRRDVHPVGRRKPPIRRFAGDDMLKAKYYDFDSRLPADELEPEVRFRGDQGDQSVRQGTTRKEATKRASRVLSAGRKARRRYSQRRTLHGIPHFIERADGRWRGWTHRITEACRHASRNSQVRAIR